MRTAIFVYSTATVRIATIEVTSVVRMSDNSSTDLAANKASTLVLQPGVYKIASTNSVTVDGDSKLIFVDATIEDKTPWPDPPPKAMAGLQTNALKAFFVIPNAKELVIPPQDDP